jgi:Tfp pilus assembly protein PilE
MRKTHKNQKGMTLISFIVAMVIIAFFYDDYFKSWPNLYEPQ